MHGVSVRPDSSLSRHNVVTAVAEMEDVIGVAGDVHAWNPRHRGLSVRTGQARMQWKSSLSPFPLITPRPPEIWLDGAMFMSLIQLPGIAGDGTKPLIIMATSDRYGLSWIVAIKLTIRSMKTAITLGSGKWTFREKM